MASLSFKKLFIVFMTMLSLFFLAVVFQNFSFKKDDYNEMYSALQGAVQTSDVDHAEKRKAAEPVESKRDINAIQIDPGVAVEDLDQPASIELNEGSLKQ
jgi:hypothetical protein